MNVSDRLLLAYLSDALEPGRRLELRERIEADAALRRRLVQLSGRLTERPPSPWRLPPPAALGAPWMLSPRVERGRHAVLGPGDTPGLAPGQPFQLRLDPVEDPGSWRVAVLYRGAEDWEVVFPTWPDEELTLMELPQEPDGSLRLDLIARPEPGPQRWAMALLPATLSIDWEAPEEQRWTSLQAEIARGAILLAVIEVEVSG